MFAILLVGGSTVRPKSFQGEVGVETDEDAQGRDVEGMTFEILIFVGMSDFARDKRDPRCSRTAFRSLLILLHRLRSPLTRNSEAWTATQANPNYIICTALYPTFSFSPFTPAFLLPHCPRVAIVSLIYTSLV